MTWRSLGKAYDWELEKFRVARCKKNILIEATKSDLLKISSDLLRILSGTSIGKPSNSDKLKAGSSL